MKLVNTQPFELSSPFELSRPFELTPPLSRHHPLSYHDPLSGPDFLSCHPVGICFCFSSCHSERSEEPAVSRSSQTPPQPHGWACSSKIAVKPPHATRNAKTPINTGDSREKYFAYLLAAFAILLTGLPKSTPSSRILLHCCKPFKTKNLFLSSLL